MSIQGDLQFAQAIKGALIVLGMLMAPLGIAVAQQTTSSQPRTGLNQRRAEDEAIERMAAEMLAKRAIKEEEKQYRENLDRARDLCDLGTTIATAFKQKNRLDESELKKLEKVEKLAKGIRRAAGGSEDEVELEKPPRDLISAIEMLDTLSQSLKANVEKTPKHVISAAVIDKANVLLELIRILRTLPSTPPSKG
jgi:hypothetical protein